MLRLEGIRKTFRSGTDELEVLRGIDLSVGEGEIVAIIGPSGVGKSTLLHIMGALDTPTSGRVYLRDTDVFAMPEIERAAFRNRTVGFVFQFHHLLRELTALENVMMPCLIGGAERDEAAARALERLDPQLLSLFPTFDATDPDCVVASCHCGTVVRCGPISTLPEKLAILSELWEQHVRGKIDLTAYAEVDLRWDGEIVLKPR